MKKIEWSNKLNLDVPQVDNQHRRLVKLTNNLVAAIQEGVADDIITPLFKELQEYTIYHFRDEEMLMEDVEYPGLPEHVEQHEQLRNTVNNYIESMEKSDYISPHEVLEFLKDWLINHIVYSDMKIAEHIRSRQEN